MTECKGLWNPCTSPIAAITTEYYRVTPRHKKVEGLDTVDMEFGCDKAKCCVFQQFPIFKVDSFLYSR